VIVPALKAIWPYAVSAAGQACPAGHITFDLTLLPLCARTRIAESLILDVATYG
jgi:hypothetical protein